MKNIVLKTSVIAVLLVLVSCSTDKKVQLSKLKAQQTALAEKIRQIENEIKAEQSEIIDPAEFKFVGLTAVATSSFDHFIRVQGKVDGDQNAAVFAEAMGTVAAKYSDVGQRVVKDQVLAQIDDKQYRSQMEGLESQYQFALEMYDKQKRLWDQKIGSEVQYLQ
jgi:membrane fusion protein (multidrug efflux system)